MVYYNPWDAQFLSYLVVDYDTEQYALEKRRLMEYPSKEYLGYFGAEGFSENDTLLAIKANPDFGLIYALFGQNIGFDTTKESAYRQERLGRSNSHSV